jgi:hypothetical protein
LALAFCHYPVLDTDFVARVRIRPARNVARGIDAACARLEKRIDGDAAIDSETGLFGQRQAWPHTDANNY